jgi:hypothetical protein
MKKVFLYALFALLALGTAQAATTCAAPSQAAPNFSGTYATGPVAVIWTPSPTAGCTTYYSTNGVSPTTSSSVYTGQTLTLNQTTVVLMVAMGPGATSSAQAGGTYTITNPSTGEGSTSTPACTITSPCIQLGCTPGAGSTVANPGTTTILRSTSSSGPFTSIATGQSPSCGYLDKAVSPGTSYWYEAQSVISGVTGPASTPPSQVNVPALKLVAPSIAVTITPSATVAAGNVAVVVSVSGTPTPSGSIALAGGGISQTATLSNGSATFTIAASGLTLGSDSLTATYTPDAASSPTYSTATAASTISVTPGAPSAVAGTVVTQ